MRGGFGGGSSAVADAVVRGGWRRIAVEGVASDRG